MHVISIITIHDIITLTYYHHHDNHHLTVHRIRYDDNDGDDDDDDDDVYSPRCYVLDRIALIDDK